MSEIGDRYRRLAEEQSESAAVILGRADTTHEQTKFDLAVMSHLKATIYTAIADLADELATLRVVGPQQARQNRNQRLRMAAVRGDEAEIDRILEEEMERLKAASNGVS